jgi:hypothetical protein
MDNECYRVDAFIGLSPSALRARHGHLEGSKYEPAMFTITKPISCQSAIIQRSERVTWLLAGVVFLSIADLFLTLSYLTSVGMSEGNPIALWLLQTTNSVWPLAIYKGITVAVCVTLLYWNRQNRQSELASWCALMILVALTVWWNQYSHYQPMLPMAEDHIVMIDDAFEQPFINSKFPSSVQ